jgi:hypothetical protein
MAAPKHCTKTQYMANFNFIQASEQLRGRSRARASFLRGFSSGSELSGKEAAGRSSGQAHPRGLLPSHYVDGIHQI